jgi:hypothetical protein
MRSIWWIIVLQSAVAVLAGIAGALTSRINLLFPIGPPRFAPSKKRAAIHFVEAMLVVGLIMLLADALIAVGPLLPRVYMAAMKVLGLEVTELLVGFGVAALGYFAWLFKDANQMWYGRVEFVLAAVAAIITAKQIAGGKELFSSLSTMVGTLYFAARGFGNAAEGKLKQIAAAKAA